MKHLGTEIHRLVEQKELVKKKVAESVGISPSYFGQLRAQKSMDLGLLEKFCNVLNVSPLYFFDGWKGESGGVSVGDITNSTVVGDATVAVASRNDTSEVNVLRELLAEKERLLAEKERMIKVLLKQLGIDDVAGS